MKKILLILFIFSFVVFGRGKEYKILISEYLPNKFNRDIIERTTIILTEARLYLQKKYKKKVSFAYTNDYLKDKNKINSLLEKNKSRYYATTDIKIKKCTKEGHREFCKGLYTIELYDKKRKRKKSFKLKTQIS